MTKFPTILYRVPGRIRKPRGGTYSYIGAADQAAYDKLIATGWFPSYEEAKGGKLAGAYAEPVDAVDELSAPTRDELEQKARELGVSFNRRTSDATLAERIAAALEA